MRRRATLLTTAFLLLSCGGSTTSASHSPSPRPSATASSAPSGTPSPVPLSGTYGLVLSAGTLNLVKADASLAASVPIATATTQFCSAQHDSVVAPAPVSATNDAVYFRDGDTKIRQVVPPGFAVDVTTVPGGPNIISFFSVSPDNQQIAVLTEDVSSNTGISERLYVEDLKGGGHHTDIYTTQVPKDKRGTTLWPMGWHSGAVVLAVFPACTFEPAGLTPSEWHVSNATNATRIAAIQANSCTLSYWPSAAGVACIDAQGVTTLYNWAGKVASVTGPGPTGSGYSMSSISPKGGSILFATGAGPGAPTPATGIVQLGPGPYATVPGHAACSWIDETHLLARDAVIQFPADTPGNVQVTTSVAPLADSGVCAGRFPGGL
jgi:hypothetical protein